MGGQLYLIKTCEIHWNVAFYILNTITLCMKKYVDLFSMSTVGGERKGNNKHTM